MKAILSDVWYAHLHPPIVRDSPLKTTEGASGKVARSRFNLQCDDPEIAPAGDPDENLKVSKTTAIHVTVVVS